MFLPFISLTRALSLIYYTFVYTIYGMSRPVWQRVFHASPCDFDALKVTLLRRTKLYRQSVPSQSRGTGYTLCAPLGQPRLLWHDVHTFFVRPYVGHDHHGRAICENLPRYRAYLSHPLLGLLNPISLFCVK